MSEFARNVLFARTHQLEIPKYRSILPPPAATEEPDDGVMRIRGSGASVIDLNHSESENHTRSIVKETERTYDDVRVMNPDDPSQHVDVKRPRKINTQSDEDLRGRPPRRNAGAAGPANVTTVYAKEIASDNVEILREKIIMTNPDYADTEETGAP